MNRAGIIAAAFALLALGCGDDEGLQVLEGSWRVTVAIGPQSFDEDLHIEVDRDLVVATKIIDGKLDHNQGRWRGTVSGTSDSFEMILDRLPPTDPAASCRLDLLSETWDGRWDGAEDRLKGVFLRRERWQGDGCTDAQPTGDALETRGSFIASTLSAIAASSGDS